MTACENGRYGVMAVLSQTHLPTEGKICCQRATHAWLSHNTASRYSKRPSPAKARNIIFRSLLQISKMQFIRRN
ncbi:Uncharacterized protein HZ326_11051 [Fusarium oxysporum f. sp. albedinis]|nr:Uncharacterized protein HZ326_11051 [Fusarium oxysporum f. sp. albedinis]